MKIAWVLLAVMVGCAGGNKDDEVPEEVPEEEGTPTYTTEVADIAVPRGVDVAVDGNRDVDEWDDASAVVLDAGWDVEIEVKWIDSALLVLFTNLSGGRPSFPELLVDPLLDGGDAFGADDWWLHASATDCGVQGAHDDYSTCAEVVDGWEANNGLADTYEFRVDFELLDVVAQPGQRLGLSFRVSDTNGFDALWPDGADVDTPSTWGSVVLVDPDGR